MVDCDHRFAGLALRVRFPRLILRACIILTVDRTCTSSMYTTTYSQLMREFGCSQEVATLGLSFFIWGLGSFLLHAIQVVVFHGVFVDAFHCRSRSALFESPIRGLSIAPFYFLDLTVHSFMAGETSTSFRSRYS